MGIQLIFVVESDERSRSDYIYIRGLMERQYSISSSNKIKISSVFMKGKGNYKGTRIRNEVLKLMKSYAHLGETHVLFCFDTDNYDSDSTDKKALVEEEAYCRKYGYEFVWFCHDIEEVFWGESVPNSEKTKKAKQFAIRNIVNDLCVADFQAEEKACHRSNLLLVVERCLNSER